MQTRSRWVFLLGGCFSLLAGATRAAAQIDSTATAAIEEVHGKIEAALIRKDASALAGFITDPFSWTHSIDGVIDTRARWLETARMGAAQVRQRAEVSEFDVRVQEHGDKTAVRTAVVRLRVKEDNRETWIQQMRVFVKEAGAWKLAAGQGTPLWDGAITETAAYARYVGEFVVSPGRLFVVREGSGALLARLPIGREALAFQASPGELASGPERFRFTFSPEGKAVEVSMLRGATEVWRARRSAP
jgi:ketosteroid isomerase-like protein